MGRAGAVCLLLGVAAAGSSLRKAVNVNVGGGAAAAEAAAEAGNIWVPVNLPDSKYYLNPTTAEERATPPSGAYITKATTVVGYTGVEEHVPRTPKGPHGQLVPDEDRISCVPHCTWNCSTPVCEQDCEPKCHRPNCQTRCPKLGEDQLAGCHVQCNAPQCRMFCPKDICEGRKTLDCQTPKCATRCEKPQCRFLCNDGLKCKTVCPDPVCDWKCKKPQACPKPECKMVCEKPPECDEEKPTLPPAGDDELVGSRGAAGFGSGKWSSGEWGKCSTACGSGTRSREVKCASGYDQDCPASQKPKSSEACAEHSGCQWAPGPWSKCSGLCSEGTQTRKVDCAGPTCSQEKPATEQKCVHDAQECHECGAVVYGGPNFDGWSLKFEPGKYTNSDMEIRGAKCDDVSSIKVLGLYCHVTAFQYGDFNKAHHGWKAEFGPGGYTTKDMLAAGAQDNDVSSMIVEKRGGPASHSGSWGSASAQNATRGGNATGGLNPFHGGNSTNPLNPFGFNPFGASSSATAAVAIFAAVAAHW
mmetsp:Transcript_52568/g.119761  ORF Transcript_52568/g.119761 Transcript_52568/m.119761 type:complete len:529 (-) Transcript_52568:95-1681(-)